MTYEVAEYFTYANFVDSYVLQWLCFGGDWPCVIQRVVSFFLAFPLPHVEVFSV